MNDTLTTEAAVLKRREAEMEASLEQAKQREAEMLLELQSCNDLLASLTAKAMQNGTLEEAQVELQDQQRTLERNLAAMTTEVHTAQAAQAPTPQSHSLR